MDVFDDPLAMAHGPDEIDRLLGGGDLAHDEVARLFATMRAAAQPSEHSDAAEAIAALTHAIAQNPMPLQRRRKRVLSKVLTTKAAAIAAIVLAGGTAAAAATGGSLPEPAQQAVSNALAHAGVSISDGNSPHHRPEHNGGSAAKGPDATGTAKYGLCKAWAAGSETGRKHKANSVAFTNLQDAAKAAHQTVEQFCKEAVPGGGTSTTPTSVAHHGPAVDTPNHGAGNPDHTPNTDHAHGGRPQDS